jgi:hypothetical protein
MSDSKVATHIPQLSLEIPPGYVSFTTVDGKEVIVPEYLLAAAHQAFDTSYKQLVLDVKGVAILLFF